jgi:hypothetical protein
MIFSIQYFYKENISDTLQYTYIMISIDNRRGVNLFNLSYMLQYDLNIYLHTFYIEMYL